MQYLPKSRDDGSEAYNELGSGDQPVRLLHEKPLDWTVEDQGVILALCFTAKQHHQLVISHLWPSALSHMGTPRSPESCSGPGCGGQPFRSSDSNIPGDMVGSQAEEPAGSTVGSFEDLVVNKTPALKGEQEQQTQET